MAHADGDESIAPRKISVRARSRRATMATALVLGAGGPTGAAWELGILAGLADKGVDVTDADRVIGTSAGSAVGAQVTAGLPIEQLYQAQLARATAEIPA